MNNYRYKARDRQGRAVTGVMEAASEQSASESLARQGYIPISVERASSISASPARFFGPEVKLAERNLFSRQLWTLLRAGVPLVNGLSSLKEQVRNPAFKRILVQVIRDLESGDSFSNALSRYPAV